MINIKFDEVQFSQDEELGKTVAEVSNCELDAYNDFMERLGKATNDSCIIDFNSIPEEVILPPKIKAISTCHTSDKWDSFKGKRQAYYKLLRSYNKMKYRAVNRLIKFFEKELSVASELSEYYKRSSNRLTNVIKNPPEDKK